MATKYKIGDIVWAKMKGFPAWPGKVIQPKTEVKKPSNKKPIQFVFFFGSENYAWIPEESIWAYADNKKKFTLTQRVPRGFKEALEAVEDVLKATAIEESTKPSDLPSIEEELAQIFPNRSTTPHKDYSREPMSGKKRRENAERQKSERKKEKENTERQRPERKSRGEAREVKEVKQVTKEPTPKRQPPKRASTPPVQAPPAKRGRPPSVRSQSSVSTPPPAPKPKEEEPEPQDAEPGLNGTEEFTQIIDMHEDGGEAEVAEEVPALPQSPYKTSLPPPTKIGFLGLGIMGQAMAANLLKMGHEVIVWNRTASKCRDIVKAGATKGNSAADVVGNCDITFSCVADPEALKDLVFGNQGVLQGINKGKSYVDMSTVDVDTAKDVYEAVTARGGRFLEAPVSGSQEPAERGELVILCAGDRTLYEDCYSCFEAMGKKSFFLGEIGNGSRMKLVVNMLLGVMTAGLAEAMALAEKVGLDQDELLQVLELSALHCPAVTAKGNAMLLSKFEPDMKLSSQQKDLRLAVDMADKVDQPLPVAAASNELFKKAKAKGYGDHDSAAVYRAADL